MGVDIALDRLAMRARPPGSPIMEQRWEKLLFLHWPIEPNTIQPLIPAGLELDTFDQSAWIGITPFRLSGLRLHPMPPIPGTDTFNEINLRTYVHHDGKPGIYFLSLDASALLPALAARVFYQLPYFSADIDFTETDGNFRFEMKRRLNGTARFAAQWRQGIRLQAPDTDSLAFFLVERYCFFTAFEGTIHMTRAYHAPWILDEALVETCQSTLLSSAGLLEPVTSALAHFSEGVQVQIWPPVPV